MSINYKETHDEVTRIVNAIYSGGGGGGGSVVNWEQLVTEGKHIATITINEEETEIYAPEGGGGGGGGDTHTYTTTEQVVGTWIDGSNVYEIVSGSKPENMNIIIEENMVVKTALIPTLTSDTGDNGNTIYSGVTSSYYAWQAFDGNTTTNDNCWYQSTRPNYLGYYFNTAVIVNYFEIQQEWITPEYVRDYTFQYSDDGTSWTDIESFSDTDKLTAGAVISHSVNVTEPHNYYRWYFTGGPSGGTTVQEAQMYNALTIYKYTKTSN